MHKTFIRQFSALHPLKHENPLVGPSPPFVPPSLPHHQHSHGH